ncbi:Uncharacterised protein [uncultured archaeon]|nr:Uncharacterised protein [uncultured archaeon]
MADPQAAAGKTGEKTSPAPKPGPAAQTISKPAPAAPKKEAESPAKPAVSDKSNSSAPAPSKPPAMAGAQKPAGAPGPAAGSNGIPLVSPMGELVVSLDTYDDIFSDFDPRPHAHRELSDDLLKELNRRYRENPKGGFEVSFYIPADIRAPKLEGVIRKRLKDHFLQERHKVRGQIKAHREKGMRYMGIGFAVLLADLFITLWQPSELWTKVVGLILTPAGWFALWTGMEKTVEIPYLLQQQYDFLDKFSKCSYMFMSEEKK